MTLTQNPDTMKTTLGMNLRKQFELDLKRLTATELLELEQRTLTNYESAKADGYCSLEAVLYFDLQQIITEQERRKEP